MIGGSAAQSSTMQSFDAAFGVEHEKGDNAFEFRSPDKRNHILYFFCPLLFTYSTSVVLRNLTDM